MRAAHPMEDPFQLPRELHMDLMSPSLLSALKQPRGPYGTPVADKPIFLKFGTSFVVSLFSSVWIFANFSILQ